MGSTSPRKCYLAGHRHIGTYRDPSQNRYDRRTNSDARARPVFGRRAFRQVDMNIRLLVKILGNPEFTCAASHDGERRRDGLLHDLAEFPGGGHLAFARQLSRFDGQQLAADFGPSQTSHLADLVFFLRNTVSVLAHAEIFIEVL